MLLRLGLNLSRNFLFILSLSRRTSEDTLQNNLLQKISKAFGSHTVLRKFTTSQRIKLADEARERGNTVYHAKLNVVDLMTTIKHTEDIFQSSHFKELDSSMDIKAHLREGDWKTIGFRVKKPKYSLLISQSSRSRKKFTVITDEDRKRSKKVARIFNDLTNIISRMNNRLH